MRTMADRYKGFRYVVEVDGVPRAAFGYCAGLHDVLQPVEYYIGDDVIDLRDVSDPTHHAFLIFAQGVAFDDELPQWRRVTEAGIADLHDGRIIEFDIQGRKVGTYKFTAAWPSFFQAVRELGAHEDRHIDTLELVCEGLDEVDT
jgi:phage tail-like protein